METRGEVAELKDNINTMIDNLRVTTERNQEQDWLKTNLAKFTRMLQGQRDLFTVGQMLLSELAPLVEAQQGTIYQMDTVDEDRPLVCGCWPATPQRTGPAGAKSQLGEGLVGQCAVEKQRILLTDVPPDYMPIHSSLGDAQPANIVVLPVLFEGQTKAVIELASLHPFTDTHLTFLEQLTQTIGVVLNTIEATMRTEDLLQAVAAAHHRAAIAAERTAADQRRAASARPSSWPSRTPKSNARTRKSSRPAARWKKRRPSLRSRRSTNPSSWPTCPTSCARR